MAKSAEEHKHVLLRTTADIMEHARLQMEACVVEYPEYTKFLIEYRRFCSEIVDDAKRVGYLGRAIVDVRKSL